MGTFLLLATEATAEVAEAVEESGFGLNTNILETNLVNLVIIIFVLVYFGRNLVGKTLAERRNRIETEIRDSEQQRQAAAAKLADQQQRLAQAQSEAERIRAEGKQRAQSAREAILTQATVDIERLREAAVQETSTEQERILAELRQRIAALAIQRVEAQLETGLASSQQKQLIDRSINQLG
jgi:F-type H+-transporting ATPase subunit b